MRGATMGLGYGVIIREEFLFTCQGPQGHCGEDTTREGAMVAYARRKVMSEEDFHESGCVMVG